MRGSVQIRYSVAFKRQVVEDLERGRFRSIQEARAHYGIRGSMTVRRWLERFGAARMMPKVVRVEKPDEADQIRQLKQQVRQLEQALGQTQLEKVLGESFLQMACERLGEDVEAFKKTRSAKPAGAFAALGGPGRGRDCGGSGCGRHDGADAAAVAPAAPASPPAMSVAGRRGSECAAVC